MWRIEAPRSIWTTLGSFGIVLLVMAGCFFPLVRDPACPPEPLSLSGRALSRLVSCAL